MQQPNPSFQNPGSQVSGGGFERLAEFAHLELGLVLEPSKSAMIESRLRHRLRALSINSLEDYCDYFLKVENSDEIDHLTSCLTTNVSSFFREPHHFELFIDDQVSNPGASTRVWSCGCSTGQEPYSLVMSWFNHPELDPNRLKVLATDIDRQVIKVAKLGTYEPHQVDSLASDIKARYFDCIENVPGKPVHKVRSDIRQTVTFNELNLLKPWPMKKKFHAIFCRNVVIYFDTDTQLELWPRFHSALEPGGFLFVGHSERVTYPGFRAIGPTAYQKV